MNAPTSITQLQQAVAQAGGRVLRREGTRVACPHCDTPSELRDMWRQSPLQWKASYRCDSDECGHSFLTTIELQRRLKASATPNPEIDLPMSTHARELEEAQEADKPQSGCLFVGVDLDQYNVMPGGVLGLRFPRRLRKRASEDGERVSCPDCGADAVIRTSWVMAPLLRETTYHCTNHEKCGGVFVAHKEIVCTLSPSSTPNPSVQLPMSAHIRRDMLGIVLEAAGTYDYTPRRTAPVTGDLFAGDRPAGTSS